MRRRGSGWGRTPAFSFSGIQIFQDCQSGARCNFLAVTRHPLKLTCLGVLPCVMPWTVPRQDASRVPKPLFQFTSFHNVNELFVLMTLQR